MNLFIIIPGIIFTLFSTISLAYISMATMVGPWIAPTLVLMGSLILKLKRKPQSQSKTNEELALIQTIGSVGAIVAVGVGFTLPTIYFLDPQEFNQWISNPVKFSLTISAIVLSAGGLGILIARALSNKFIIKEKLEFPVSTLIYNTITSQSQSKQTKSMLYGFSFSIIICFFRDGLLKFKGFLPNAFYLLRPIAGNEIAIAIWPTVWAIGFIMGIKIVFPLIIGMLSKYIIISPLHKLNFLQHLTLKSFTMAFAGGMVVFEFLFGMLRYPNIIYKTIKKNFGTFSINKIFNRLSSNQKLKEMFKGSEDKKKLINFIEPVLIMALSVATLYYLGFPAHYQILLLTFIIIATYQISYLGAKIGLIPFGRFATFVMLPMILLFKLSYLQITIVCVFFNICAATASDLLFDYKIGELCKIKFDKIRRYQWLGLLITAASLGFFLWLLFTNLKIGTAELFAQRAKSRALLIMAPSFDLYAVGFGFLFGLILKKFKVSPTMVFGGVLMPNTITIGLLIGALGSFITKRPERFAPFWSGVFASESVWILSIMILKMFI